MDGIKGVVLTHRNLVANTLQLASWVVRARKGKEVFLSVLPFFHVYGMAVAMNAPIFLASTMLILPRFEVRSALRAIKRYRPTFFPGVPTMFTALSQEKDAEKHEIACLRVCYSGGAPLSLEILEDFEKLTGGRVIEGYGLAETSPVHPLQPVFGKRKRGSVGLPYPDTFARIVVLEAGDKVLGPEEVGELCIKGPQVMKGYWKMPEETAKTIRDGWLFTGDIARMDEGRLFLHHGYQKRYDHCRRVQHLSQRHRSSPGRTPQSRRGRSRRHPGPVSGRDRESLRGSEARGNRHGRGNPEFLPPESGEI